MNIDEIIEHIGVTPYHREKAGVIYCADCMDILPKMPEGCVDLVLTDPPYPNMKRGIPVRFDSGVGKRRNIKNTVGSMWGNQLDWMAKAERIVDKGLLIFCSFHSADVVALTVSMDRVALITWFKRNATPSMNNSPQYQTEFIWAFRKNGGLNWRALKTLYDIPNLQSGCMASERICDSGGGAIHPCQKPLSLMKELTLIGGDTIADLFCGTGTTLVAAKQLGRQFIGIEISAKYAAIAVDRLRQGVLEL